MVVGLGCSLVRSVHAYDLDPKVRSRSMFHSPISIVWLVLTAR